MKRKFAETGVYWRVVFIFLFCTVSAEAQLARFVAGSLDRPTYVTHVPGDYHRLFILEQYGEIRILFDEVMQAEAFIDLDPIVTSHPTAQAGLFGLAFHPDYESNGYFYVFYVNNDLDCEVSRFTVTSDPDVADFESQEVIITIPHGGENGLDHFGGMLEFGPDGYLYIATGDGGGNGMLDNNAQNGQLLLGKMLRIDVNGAQPYEIPEDNPFIDNPEVLDEIWALGLRNPWRFSFDSETGDLYIADVGLNLREEINFIPAGSAGGQNFGWANWEGTLCNIEPCNADGITFPIYQYEHGPLGGSVTGGYVYRGCEMPLDHGRYFFGDFLSTRIWTFRYEFGQIGSFIEWTEQLEPTGGGDGNINWMLSFGTDAFGELYFLDRGSSGPGSGELYKFYVVDENTDCNQNGFYDRCDIAEGFSQDINGNDIPDECEAAADDGVFPEDFHVYANYPNPFNAQTYLRFNLNQAAPVKVDIFDIQGKHIKTLTNQSYPPGDYRLSFSAENLSSGVYIAHFDIGEMRQNVKMILLK